MFGLKSFTRWIRHLVPGARPNRTIRGRKRPFHLFVEQLEDRAVPAAVLNVTLQAADPTLYSFSSPATQPALFGQQSNPIAGATFSTSVSSLAPSQVTLGQIVPFELRVTNTGTT